MAVTAKEGIETIPSTRSVDATVEELERLLTEKGVKVFAVVDHAGEARAAGLAMPPTKLVLFGSPKAGTPIMLATPSAALDLPLKILVAEDAGGGVVVSYNSAAFLRARHGFPEELVRNIAAAATLAAEAAG
jgi:uncharacterized protein (DUF302 family)